MFKNGGYRSLYNWKGTAQPTYWSTSSKEFGCLLQIIPLLIVPFAGIVQSCRYLATGPPDLFDVSLSCFLFFFLVTDRRHANVWRDSSPVFFCRKPIQKSYSRAYSIFAKSQRIPHRSRSYVCFENIPLKSESTAVRQHNNQRRGPVSKINFKLHFDGGTAGAAETNNVKTAVKLSIRVAFLNLLSFGFSLYL